MSGNRAGTSPFRQPKAVWAVAFAAGLLAEHLDLHVPFLLGAVAVVAGIVVLRAVRDALDAADASGAGGPDVEQAVREVPAVEEEAVAAEAALRAVGRDRS